MINNQYWRCTVIIFVEFYLCSITAFSVRRMQLYKLRAASLLIIVDIITFLIQPKSQNGIYFKLFKKSDLLKSGAAQLLFVAPFN